MSEPIEKPIPMTADAGATGNPSLAPTTTQDTPASAKREPSSSEPSKTDPLTQVQQLFVEAAKSDQAMATTFSKLLSTVEELREQNRFVIANLRALILRLSDSGTIHLTASELESFGVSKKAAVVRAGR